MLTRRSLLGRTLAGAAFLGARSVAAQACCRDGNLDLGAGFPDPTTFQSGDFIWVKGLNATVAFSVGGGQDAPAAGSADWEKERHEYIESVKNQTDKLTRERVKKLEQMTYKEFLDYFAAEEPRALDSNLIRTQGLLDHWSVGHVAIVDVDADRKVSLIEAVIENVNAVRRIDYDRWLGKRELQWVWHGRLKGFSAAQRAKIATEAAHRVGCPYSLWTYDLDDESSFYCSKLVWQSIYRALNKLEVDDDPPKRPLWFTPKQFINLCGKIDVLHCPGKY